MSELIKVTVNRCEGDYPVFLSNAADAREVARRFADLYYSATFSIPIPRLSGLVPSVDVLQDQREQRWLQATSDHRSGVEDPYFRIPDFFDEDWYQAIHPVALAVQRNSDNAIAISTVDYKKGKTGNMRLTPPQTLGRFLRSWGMPDDVVERYVIKSQSAGIEAVLVESSEAIAAVYRVGRGPLHSCMSYSMSHYDTDGIAPVLAYGGKSDIKLFVIRLKESGNVVGRALVWPDKMIHGRIYGRDKACQQALTEAGYTRGSFHGAKLNKIPIKRLPRKDDLQKVVVPYIDGLLNRYAYVIASKDWLHVIDTGGSRTDRILHAINKTTNTYDNVFPASNVNGIGTMKEVDLDDSKIEEILAA